MSIMLRLVSFRVAHFHSIRTSAPFLIALILQWQLLSLTQVCRSSFARTFISSLENLYICEDGYPRLAWQDDTENAQWMELLQPFTAMKNLYLGFRTVYRALLPISVLMTSTTRGCAPTGVPASETRGPLSRPGLDFLDRFGTRGDAIITRPSCHPKDSPKRHVIPRDEPATSQLLHWA